MEKEYKWTLKIEPQKRKRRKIANQIYQHKKLHFKGGDVKSANLKNRRSAKGAEMQNN